MLFVNIPNNSSDSENIVLKIPSREVDRAIIHYGELVQTIFFHVTAQMAVEMGRILKSLNPDEKCPGPINKDGKFWSYLWFNAVEYKIL